MWAAGKLGLGYVVDIPLPLWGEYPQHVAGLRSESFLAKIRTDRTE